jgi:acyl dehydratase
MNDVRPRRYLEDFAPGDRMETPAMDVTAEDVADFARRYDPQPFHLDEAAARASVFAGIAASGWHTAALTMRMMVVGKVAGEGPLLGLGVEDLRWPRPVRPGDRLSAMCEVLEVRRSKGRTDRGVVRLRTTTVNQRGEEVYVMTSSCLVDARGPAEGG